MAKTFAPSICLTCRTKNKDCCTHKPRSPMTVGEIATISSLGFKLKDFAIAGEYSKNKIKNEEGWWKNSMIAVNGKLFKINIRKKQNGHCIFLRDGVGCLLAENRPVTCRIYPFWLSAKNKIIYEPGQYCLFRKNTTIKDGMKLIQETQRTIRSYFNSIKDDCVKNKEKHRKIILELLGANK